MYDLLLVNGTVVDGSGQPSFTADVAVKDGKVVALGKVDEPMATRILDCTGLCVSPGWVDFHGHVDANILVSPIGQNLLIQGCTLTVSGNCGFSPAPVEGPARGLVLSSPGRGCNLPSNEAMAQAYPEMEWSVGQFLDELEKARPALNQVHLVGQNSIRRSVTGHDARPALPDEIKQMRKLLDRSLDEGAFGLSFGLAFIPSCWAQTPELIELAKVVAQRDGVLTTHQRGERETNIEATREIVGVAEKSGARTNISHMQSKWPVLGNGVPKLEMLKDARGRGVDISCDYEVYNMTPASLAGYLSVYYFTNDEILEMLRSETVRAWMKKTLYETDPYDPLGRDGGGLGTVSYRRRGWDRVLIFDCPSDRSLEGKSIAAAAVLRRMDPEDVLFDLTLAEDGLGPRLVYDCIEDEHFRIVPWEHCIVPSVDAVGAFDPATELTAVDYRQRIEMGSASNIGLFPRVLGAWVREEKLLTLEDGIRRLTSLPCQRLGLTDRGYVRPGMWADLTVFDKDTVAMMGPNPTPTKPETCWPTGISYVVINGEVTMEGHRYTGAKAGRVLRH